MWFEKTLPIMSSVSEVMSYLQFLGTTRYNYEWENEICIVHIAILC